MSGNSPRYSPTAPGPTQSNYSHISAGGNARLLNGNVYNYNTNNYTIGQRRSDETLNSDQRHVALIRAAAEGQTRRVDFLIRSGMNIDYATSNGLTALHHAALSGFKDTVEALLHAGADVNSISETYGTSLCLASLKARHDVVNVLLAGRARINTFRGELGTALHAASASGDAAVVKSLLDAGADINAQAVIAPQIVFALQVGGVVETDIECSGVMKLSELLRQSYAPLDMSKGTGSECDRKHRTQHTDLGLNEPHYIRLRTRRFPDTATDKDLRYRCVPLYMACLVGCLHLVSCLVEHGANIEAEVRWWSEKDWEYLSGSQESLDGYEGNGRGCLNVAIEQNRTEILSYLIQAGSSLDEQGCNLNAALVHALKSGHRDLALILVKYGAYDEEAVNLAILENDSEMVKAMVPSGVVVPNTNLQGASRLYSAAYRGAAKPVMAILDTGTDINDTTGVQPRPTRSYKCLKQPGMRNEVISKLWVSSNQQALRRTPTEAPVQMFVV